MTDMMIVLFGVIVLFLQLQWDLWKSFKRVNAKLDEILRRQAGP